MKNFCMVELICCIVSDATLVVSDFVICHYLLRLAQTDDELEMTICIVFLTLGD